MLPFSHPSVINLRRKLGMEGYGIYCAISGIVEQGGNQPMPIDAEALAYDLHSDPAKVSQVITDFGLFTLYDDNYFSNPFSETTQEPTKATSVAKSVRGRKAAIARWSRRNDAPPEPDLFNQPTITEDKPPTITPPKAKPPSEKTIVHSRCKDAFLELYATYHNGEQFYWQAKDAKALDTLINQIKFKMPTDEHTDIDKIVANYRVFIEVCITKGNDFLRDHIDNCYISSHFNDIYNQLKNGNQHHSRDNPTASPGYAEGVRQFVTNYMQSDGYDGAI